jgi:hypothetical protein
MGWTRLESARYIGGVIRDTELFQLFSPVECFDSDNRPASYDVVTGSEGVDYVDYLSLVYLCHLKWVPSLHRSISFD